MESLLQYRVNDYYVAVFAWNIFLALIPCFIAYRLNKGYHLKKWGNISSFNKLAFLLVFLVWFFFFPNTAYLIADVRHLVAYCDNPGFYRACPENAWMVPLFFTYGLMGVPTFYYALRKMNQVIGRMFGGGAGLFFPIVMIPVTALGLLLGLVERFNSWEVLSEPLSIVKTAIEYLRDPEMLVNLAAYSLMLYFIYYGLAYILKKVKEK